MQGGHGYYGGRDSPPQGYGYGYGYGGYGYDAGGYSSNGYPSAAPAYDHPLPARRAHDFPAPLNGLEFQPSETCPKNYVIFDQTCTKSRVMFHPSLAHKLGGSSGNDPCYGGGGAHDAGKGAYRDNNGYDDDNCSVRLEDTDEIDALLSSEDGDEDDVLSTGRTPGYRDGSSPDSTCSSSYGGAKPRPEGRKKDRMKKMMRTLKGIIPGGNQMDTPAVLDEAVRYLKSLKVEAKKLGVSGSDS
ncbi:transcription factor bHLH144-like [Phragmites australis]|uniref:transcription factor bHLH144-like n=1 Tax=Phragmites australis TaxID=29695 RepID=UPI002D79740F|nr:transcription factor bHLH144-like [Phragmites australis]